MFKLLSPRFLAVPIAWLTIMLFAGLNAATPFLQGLGVTPRISWIVLVVQGLVAVLFLNPIWRWIWTCVPQLSRWFYPDLNGEWDVELESNWPRIDATLRAANGEIARIDMRNGPEEALPPLGKHLMRAKIHQSWADMRMTLWNPKGAGPIIESRTLSVEPFRGEDGRHGLIYVFEQENDSTAVADDRKFLGAVRVVVDRDDMNVLCGQMWSDRVWRRGMNTAAELRLKRRKSKAPRRQK
ncbi:hypothetical protein [Tritonibacter scottomollicae]|uniref:hypothetical protein n=1 Tax=Tritonibacter scottomollicae TaxID=483013 RepID=UPI003AA7CF8D